MGALLDVRDSASHIRGPHSDASWSNVFHPMNDWRTLGKHHVRIEGDIFVCINVEPVSLHEMQQTIRDSEPRQPSVA